MGDKTKISWASATWNPITGCTKISPACDNCYAERMSHRLAGRFGYPADKPFRVTLHPDKLDQPLRWKRPRRIFVASMGDLFHKDVPFSFITNVFNVMAMCPQHTFQLLTKRPEKALMFSVWAEKAPHDLAPIRDAWPLPNVWIGVTAEDQQRADDRIPTLLQIPAAKRFVSVEPMLGSVDVSSYLRCESCGYSKADDRIHWDHHMCSPELRTLDWVICGGESGPKARPMHPDWVRSLRDQCVEAGVPFHYKQWGEWAPYVGRPNYAAREIGAVDMVGRVSTIMDSHEDGITDHPPWARIQLVGKKKAGRELDGRTWDEFPDNDS